jgi:glycosyltransferase involved in cell wall biosynthesis
MVKRDSLSVYFLSGCDRATTFEYRVLQKQEQLAHYGLDSAAQKRLAYSEHTLEAAMSHDILYLYRVPYSFFIEELIRQARARRIPVLFGVDDLVFMPEMSKWVDAVTAMSHHQAALYYEGAWRFRRTLLESDYVVASTEYLAELARGLGKTAFVHRNGLSQWMIDASPSIVDERRRREGRDRIIMGYGSGTATHRKDLAEAAPALAQVMSRHENVELHIVGPLHIDEPLALPDRLREFEERVQYLPLVGWREWLGLLGGFDINLAPLEADNPYCLAKSEIKHTEAAVIGLPTVASRTAAFEYAIRDGETGFLAESDAEWSAALERLIGDPALRSCVGDAARKDVLNRYAPPVLGRQLVNTLETAKEHTSRRYAAVAVEANPQDTPLILSWIITEPPPGSGGHTDIFRMINLLADFGHQINAYIVPRRRLTAKGDLEIRDYIRRHFVDLEGSVFKWTGGPMVESDAVLLTHWTTAYKIRDIPTAAKVFYFVQDWEPFFNPMGVHYLRAEQTYKMGFSCITLGQWLTDHLRALYDADADYFDLAVDHSIYYPRPVEKPERPRVCFYARPSTPRRLFPMGIEALTLVNQRRPDVEIVLYGSSESDLRRQGRIPFPYTNLGILKENELAELFSSADVGVVLSSTNCSLVPPEMMACKCAVVDLNRETVRGVLENEVNALLAEPTPEAIADAVVRLLGDEVLRQRLIDTAYQQVKQRSWAKSARRVEEILYRKLPPTRQAWAPYRSAPRSALPALDELPSQQREHLDAIHRQQRGVIGQLKARAKNLVKRFLRVNANIGLSDAPVQMMGELTGRRSLGQSFVARHDNLCRVDVLVSTYGRRNTRDVVFHLKTSPEAEDDLARVRVNASQFLDREYVSFVFNPLPESKEKSFYFYMDSPESVPGDAITAWAYSQVELPEFTLYRNHRKQKGQLIFGLFYVDDQVGEVGERPYPQGFSQVTTFWQRLTKAYQLVSTRDLSRLRWEIQRYLLWRLGLDR